MKYDVEQHLNFQKKSETVFVDLNLDEINSNVGDCKNLAKEFYTAKVKYPIFLSPCKNMYSGIQLDVI